MRRYISHGLDGLMILLIIIILVLAPLRIGAVEHQSIIFLFFTSCVLFSLMWGRQFVNYKLDKRLSAPIIRCIFTLLVFLSYIMIQIIPMPEALIGALSPASNLWWNQTGAYGHKGFATLSLDISRSIWYLITVSIYFIFFTIVIFLINTKFKFNILLLTIFSLGQFQVLFDIISKNLGYDFFTPAQLDGHTYRLTGTFTNSNNVSALINLSFSSGLALVYNLFTKFRSSRSISILFLATIFALSLLVLIYGSIKAGSSGGMLSLLSAMAIIVILYQYNRFCFKSILLFFVLCSGFLIAIIFFGSREINLLELTQNLSLSGREQLWIMTLRVWRDFTVFGVGAGAFEWVLPIYKNDLMTSLRISNAHSGHLQSLTELGLIGIAIIIMFAYFYLQCMRDSMIKLKDKPAILLIMLVGVTAFLIHETIDNNFLIPAVGLPFFCMLAMLVSIPNIKSRQGV